MAKNMQRSAWARAVSIAAVAFGLLTLKEGGAVLFIDGAARAAAGAYVPFVLWFNFLSGFVYVIAGIGIALRKPWAGKVAIALAFAILAVFGLFGWHVFQGGAYELRTMGAMVLRSAVWISLAIYLSR